MRQIIPDNTSMIDNKTISNFSVAHRPTKIQVSKASMKSMNIRK
jgi:hypothetical protein